MEKLIEALEAVDFESIDIDAFYDGRDAKCFDSEWMRIYNQLEAMKNEESYTAAKENENRKFREAAFLKIYSLTEDSELAGYVSDDFGLIIDAQILGFSDPWLERFIACYANSTIPCGEI